jgi:hypothetical protein
MSRSDDCIHDSEDKGCEKNRARIIFNKTFLRRYP